MLRTRSCSPSRVSHSLAMLVIVLSVVGIFRDALATDQLFAFRDAAHFYYPLFNWITQESAAGHRWWANELPLWNPLEGLGASVVADATSSLFYPGKVLFFLPGPYGFWYKAYIIGHVWLCGLTSFRLARYWQQSVPAATLAAVSYSLSGNVLFQYCNVVYLVGAAWLPLAILSGDRLLRLGDGEWRLDWTRSIALAFCLAMMVLGGDAQMAYHCGILLAALAWFRRRSTASHGHNGSKAWLLRRSLFRLVFAAAIACGLVAVQSLPAAHAVRNSDRASYVAPRNVYEAISRSWTATANESDTSRDASADHSATLPSDDDFHNAWLGRPETGHHSAVFDFSVGPWRFIELVWPNIGGKMFPQNRRWMSAIPAEGRCWTPTLYLGILPILLASLTIRFRGGSVRRRFLTWVATFAVAAALGGYGVGWMINELSFDLGLPNRLAIGDPFGGLYWLLTLLLPGYVYFRYPAKLWVIATFAISQLAAVGFDHAIERIPTAGAGKIKSRLAGRTAVLVGISLLLATIVWLAPLDWETVFSHAPPSQPFGPLVLSSIAPQIVRSVLHTALVGLGLMVISPRVGRPNSWISSRWMAWSQKSSLRTSIRGRQKEADPSRPGPSRSAPSAGLRERHGLHRLRCWALVALTTIELVAAHQWLVPLAPALLMENRKSVPHASNSLRPIRIYRRIAENDLPWRTSSSPDRLNQVLQWNASSLFPKCHLLRGVGVIPSRSSITSSYQTELFAAVTKTNPAKGLPKPFAAALGVESELSVRNAEGPVPQCDWQELVGSQQVWIVRGIQWIKPIDPRNRNQLRQACRQIAYADADIPRDLRTSAVVEASILPDLHSIATGRSKQIAADADGDTARIVAYSNHTVQLNVALTSPGLVVFNDAYDEGWRAFVSSHAADGHAADGDAADGDGEPMEKTIYRTNGMMRGIFLPAGRFTIDMQYQPTDIRIGALISAVTWSACLLYLIIHFGLHIVRRVAAHL